ncbi:MAG: hypothetical protein H0V29_08535 [Thermoleophilaceae bacterium]|nr:hypothetical protein [Thermoleophilaceae bacterium]
MTDHKKLRASGMAAALALALGLAACGGEKTDVSKPVEELNTSLKATGVTLDCPKEVDGGAGTDFECTFKGPGGDQKTTLTIKKQGDDLTVDGKDQKQFQTALEKSLGE